ncbi:MAG TPA: NAD(P)H-dependent oxidoreductase subunit E [Sandaracinaceae bacterium LLY-WYZ-13_1]|nr:NAD(P)H-dependent oxidoreductase subunit E [Sandaracinaceae bacterium LLY-WYZ-13_1]
MVAFSLSEDKEKVVDELIARYPTKMAACIPVLHLCQEERGWVSPDIVEFVAERLDMSTSQVEGVVTFYTMYHREEVAPNVVWVCRTLSCDLRGAKSIQDHLEKRLRCHVGETSADGKVTLLKAECLAACGNAPMIQLNDEFHEHLTTESLDRILDGLGVAPMPAELRTSPPEPVPAPEPPAETAATDEGPSTDEGTSTDEGEEE